MDSVANKAARDTRRQEEIKRQILQLQAQLEELPSNSDAPPNKKQKMEEPSIVAPATPSPRKKRLLQERQKRQASPTPTTRKPQPTRSQPPSKQIGGPASRPSPDSFSQSISKSSFVSQLRSLNPSKPDNAELTCQRTEGFSEKPATVQAKAPFRDETMAIIEDIKLGPMEHKPLIDDPLFERLEPNSGIRLNSRKLSHDAVQDHLTGRYFLPPSLLYSVVRLQPNKQAYEVPVEGDWVTIAVVAERGEVRFTSSAGYFSKDKGGTTAQTFKDDGEKQGVEKNSDLGRKKKSKDDGDEENTRKGGKKYVHLKLVDLGHRSRSTLSSTSRGALRGDAQLSLLLFESDYFDKLISKDEKGKEKVQKLWRGGSGGAFEECFSKLHPGVVIALLNPKVLKPYQNTKNPASSSILALTPPSASAIEVIGQAHDLGRCTVRRRDGKPCGAWVDKRVSSTIAGSSKSSGEDICEYHVQTTIQRTRAGRAEFSVGTSGMTTTARKQKANEYDPARQWGLKPEAGSRGPDGETTYVLGGHVASSSTSYGFQAPGTVGETMGRESQARAKRRLDKNGDKALRELLEMNRNGGSAVTESCKEAAEIVRRAKEAVKTNGKEKEIKRSSRTTTDAISGDEGIQQKENQSLVQSDMQTTRKSYSAEMIKRLGFDPTSKPYGQKGVKQKPPTSLLSGQKREFNLGPPPGKRVRSGVIVPVPSMPKDDSESELEIED